MIQRYDMAPYAMGWEKNDDGEVCMSRDVEELEAKYAELESNYYKLLEAHIIMNEALEWLTTDACFLNCSHASKRQFAVKTLQRVAEVMP